MARGSEHTFFERAVTVHRYDCEAVSGAGGEPADGEQGHDNASLALAMPDESIIRYTIAARPLYDGVRRLIGQVAGLLVLVEAGGRRDVLDLPDLVIARERWHELREMLRTLGVPRGFERHFGHIERAHAGIGDVLDGFDAARRERDWQRRFDGAAEAIKSAYSSLQAASEPGAGMTMVDFNHACCSCALRWRQQGGSNGPIFDLGA